MTHSITLVSDIYLSKTEALRALSELLGVPVNDSEPSNAVLDLDGGVVLSIEVPKFGEDLPLTIDLSSLDESALAIIAREVTDEIVSKLSWSVRAF